jgi:LmbE family N-acetylglucosaminyl deacetylase
LSEISGFSTPVSYPKRGFAHVIGYEEDVSGIVVLAPHPDDDAIGCGGTIARCVDLGLDVDVIYVTDGAASHPNSKRFPGPKLRALREREAAAGLRALGVRAKPAFLGVPDGAVSHLRGAARETVVATLRHALESPQCTAVFAPWWREPHPDHAATGELVLAALRDAGRRPRLLWYAVWLDVFGLPADRPNATAPFVEVGLSHHEAARKRAAVLAHVSQTTRLIDDDPDGFCAAPDVLGLWLRPVERFYGETAHDTAWVSDALRLGTNGR